MSPVAFALNPRITNKPPAWQESFADGWITAEAGDISGLKAAITSGTAFVAAALNSEHRSSAAFQFADLVCVDIDGGMDIDTALAHPLVQQAVLMYTTPSHKEEPEGHRFRILFRLPRRIEDPDLYKAIATLLIRSLGGDKSCSDPCRLFYGNDRARVPLWNPVAVLPDSIISDAYQEMEANRNRFNRVELDCDEASIERAIWCLERVLEPTRDGERDRFIRITAAAAAGGDLLFPAWSDWAARGHHGSGKNSRQSSERFFRGMKGTSLGTLFFLASEERPHWRDELPQEIRHSGAAQASAYPPGVAGYSHEDFLGDPDEEPAHEGPSLFDPQRPWTLQPPTPHQEEPAEESINEEQQELEVEPDHQPRIRRRGRPPRSGGRSADQQDIVETIKSRLQRLYPGLRLNTMSQQLEFGPAHSPQVVHDPSTAYVRISRGAGQVFGKQLVHDLAIVIGHENRYHPVTSYVERCAAVAEPVDYFDRLASTLIGLPDDPLAAPKMTNGRYLADVVLERFFIGAVARIFNPGRRHDWMPILIGPQNCGKSNFFQYATPPDHTGEGSYPWCSTIQQGIRYLKDKPHALHAGWIVVLDEVERYFKRQYVEELKNIVSVSVDRSARKYENEREFPRSFVLAGAANSEDFLQDPTGNRRFMPIRVAGVLRSGDDPRTKIIDLDRVKRDRDAIWSAAYKAYLEGRTHTWTSHEIASIGDYLESFGTESPLDQQIQRLLKTRYSGYWRGLTYVSLMDMCDWLNIPVQARPSMQQVVSDTLKRLGLVSKQVSIEGSVRRIWMERSKLDSLLAKGLELPAPAESRPAANDLDAMPSWSLN